MRLLARHLDRARYRIDVLPCFRKEGMPEQTHASWRPSASTSTPRPTSSRSRTPSPISRASLPGYDLVVSCQNVADIYPALERLAHRPPLIEHGGLVSEALAGPEALHRPLRRRLRQHPRRRRRPHAGARRATPSRSRRWSTSTSFDADGPRADARRARASGRGEPLIGWVGRLDRKKRVEDFLDAAALVHAPGAGGPLPGDRRPGRLHAGVCRRRCANAATALGLDGVLRFLGDRADVPRPARRARRLRLAVARRGHAARHRRGRARPASPAVATADNGALQQIEDGVSGLFVPHEDPAAAAAAILRLVRDPALRRAPRRRRFAPTVAAHYAAEAVVPQWRRSSTPSSPSAAPAPPPTLFRSFLQGGWECSTHRLPSGRRLDLVAGTGHDANAAADYRQLGVARDRAPCATASAGT